MVRSSPMRRAQMERDDMATFAKISDAAAAGYIRPRTFKVIECDFVITARLPARGAQDWQLRVDVTDSIEFTEEKYNACQSLEQHLSKSFGTEAIWLTDEKNYGGSMGASADMFAPNAASSIAAATRAFLA